MGRNKELFIAEREAEEYYQDQIDVQAEIWERNIYIPPIKNKNKHYARKMKSNRLKKTSKGRLYNPNLPF